MTQSNKSAITLKLILFTQTIALLIYTVVAVKNQGWTLFNVMLENVTALNWSGQFNLDFSCYLTLSGIWIMWRGNFKPQSIAIGLIALIFGIVFFAPYVLYLLYIEKGNIVNLLVGKK